MGKRAAFDLLPRLFACVRLSPDDPFSLACRFVDRDLSKTGAIRCGARSLFVALVPIFAIAAISRERREGAYALGWGAAIAISTVWLLFVAWRGWRLLKANAVKGDRHYDRHVRTTLPSEYEDTESATKARRKARRRGI